MRSSEKNFLKHVGNELVTLYQIAEKAGITLAEAEELAKYLEKQGLVRTTIEPLHINPMGPIYVRLICKPIDKRNWKEKYWWVISICSAIGGALLKAGIDWMTRV